MEKRDLGSLRVSVAGLGTNNFGMRIDHDQSVAVIRAAFDEGVTFYDTADVYSAGKSEEWLADALSSVRDEVVIATKFGWYEGAAATTAATAVEGSLRRLRTDHVDLLYCHRPDPNVPLAETLGAMDDLVTAGKVREVGCSNVTSADVVDWIATADRLDIRPLACVEDQYNVLFRKPERELIPTCIRSGLTFVPFFPLASGLLTGKYQLGQVPAADSRLGWGLQRVARETGTPIEELTGDVANALRASTNWHPHERYDVNLDIVAQLEVLARETGRSMTELALGWLAAQPAIPTVIAGATTPEQARANARATICQLSDEEVADITHISQPAVDAGAV
jgi:aryl-alcohol dehydrogenase-like predicted oxidoreductase